MANIEILLREHVQHLGKCGDVVRVRPGYARNFLFPNGLAAEATPDNKKLMTRKRARLDVEEKKRDEEIDARVAKITGVVVATSAKADDQGHLFGSVNAALVSELLVKAGHGIPEKDIRMETPIKAVGAHVVKIHVHGERFAEITVNVNAEA